MNILRGVVLAAALPVALQAQLPVRSPGPAVPSPSGWRLFLMTDMEGMASVVANREIIAGNEGERYRNASSPDYWNRYRLLHTQEVNAVIAGARRGGARSFVVNEGHGGNLFANLLPWDLDTAALLIRGWPKPMVMTTGLDSTARAVFFIGAHAGAGSLGVIAHTYAFDSILVNGRNLNESGINALVAGEYGVPFALVSGDDVLCGQVREILGDGPTCVVTKWALGRNAAITLSPAVVRQMLRDSAAAAVQRVMRGETRPFTMEKPYRVQFLLRRSYPQEYVDGVAALAARWNLERVGDRGFRTTMTDARDLARLLDEVELVVLR